MSMKAVDWAFAQDLEGNTKMILVYLARRANESGVCFPSHRLIAEECGCSQRTVSRALTALREAGLVEGDRRGTNHTAEPKYYTLVGWLRSSDTPPVASLDTSQVADRSVSKKQTSELLRSSSVDRKRSVERQKIKRAERKARKASQQEDEPGDPTVAAASTLGEDEVPVVTVTAPGLAKEFHRAVREAYPADLRLGSNSTALAKHFADWMDNGIEPQAILDMVAVYIADPRKSEGSPHWKSFLAQRERLLEQAEKIKRGRAGERMTIEEQREFYLGKRDQTSLSIEEQREKYLGKNG